MSRSCCDAPPISGSELECLTDVSASMLPATATILRRTPASDSAGGQTVTWTAVQTGVPCRAVAVGGGERDSQGRWEVAVTYRLSFPAGTDIRASDRVTIDSQTFDVTVVLARWTEIVRQVEAAQVTP